MNKPQTSMSSIQALCIDTQLSDQLLEFTGMP